MKPHFDDGQITIYHGDVFDVVEALDGFDALITDPPYSSGGQFRGDRQRGTLQKYTGSYGNQPNLPSFTGDTRDQRGFLLWANLWLSAARLKAAPGANLLIFTDWRQLPTVTDAVQCAGWVWSGVGVWDKGNGRPQAGHFRHVVEYVVHGRNGPAGDRQFYPDGVCRAAIGKEKREHITQKPLSVMRWLAEFAPPEGVIFDPFMGSGSTLMAAKMMGRRAIGCDIDKFWCDVAVERLRQNVLPLTDNR